MSDINNVEISLPTDGSPLFISTTPVGSTEDSPLFDLERRMIEALFVEQPNFRPGHEDGIGLNLQPLVGPEFYEWAYTSLIRDRNESMLLAHAGFSSPSFNVAISERLSSTWWQAGVVDLGCFDDQGQPEVRIRVYERWFRCIHPLERWSNTIPIDMRPFCTAFSCLLRATHLVGSVAEKSDPCRPLFALEVRPMDPEFPTRCPPGSDMSFSPPRVRTPYHISIAFYQPLDERRDDRFDIVERRYAGWRHVILTGGIWGNAFYVNDLNVIGGDPELQGLFLDGDYGYKGLHMSM